VRTGGERAVDPFGVLVAAPVPVPALVGANGTGHPDAEDVAPGVLAAAQAQPDPAASTTVAVPASSMVPQTPMVPVTLATSPLNLPGEAPFSRRAPAVDGQPRQASMGLLYIWILLFGFVGTQLGWTLRPFFGSPGEPFGLFRHLSGTFYGDILHTIGAAPGSGVARPMTATTPGRPASLHG
jgi:hypothetical protein